MCILSTQLDRCKSWISWSCSFARSQVRNYQTCQKSYQFLKINFNWIVIFKPDQSTHQITGNTHGHDRPHWPGRVSRLYLRQPWRSPDQSYTFEGDKRARIRMPWSRRVRLIQTMARAAGDVRGHAITRRGWEEANTKKNSNSFLLKTLEW